MSPARRGRLARWLPIAVLQLLLLVPPGLAAWGRSTTLCGCGMERGHCSCSLMSHSRASAGPGARCGMSGMNGAMPSRCSLGSAPAAPVDSRTAPVSPGFRHRLGISPRSDLRLDPTPRGAVPGLDVSPLPRLSSPPEVPPPRSSF